MDYLTWIVGSAKLCMPECFIIKLNFNAHYCNRFARFGENLFCGPPAGVVRVCGHSVWAFAIRKDIQQKRQGILSKGLILNQYYFLHRNPATVDGHGMACNEGRGIRT